MPGWKRRRRKLSIVLQGGVEPVKSQATGKVYFTARTANVPATFDEITCRSLVGSQFEGIIRKVRTLSIHD
jgi:hypothetical protein